MQIIIKTQYRKAVLSNHVYLHMCIEIFQQNAALPSIFMYDYYRQTGHEEKCQYKRRNIDQDKTKKLK